jgi:hypothetical protein
MYSLQVTFLLLIHSLSTSYCELLVSAEAVRSIELLPDGLGLGPFGDFEILSHHEDGDEDVYHIRKRAGNNNNDCRSSDCLNYSAWSENEKMGWDDEPDTEDTITDSEGENFKKRSLKKRDRKQTKNMCGDVALPDGTKIPQGGITLDSPTWPGTEKLVEV